MLYSMEAYFRHWLIPRLHLTIQIFILSLDLAILFIFYLFSRILSLHPAILTQEAVVDSEFIIAKGRC